MKILKMKQKREFLFMKKEILELIKEKRSTYENLSEKESNEKILELSPSHIRDATGL